jgi:hypothetical protein
LPTRRHVRRRPEHHEHGIVRRQLQRNRRAVVGNFIARRLDDAGVGAPQLRLLARDAELRFEGAPLVGDVGHVVNLGVARAAMDPRHVGVSRAAELEIRRRVQQSKRCLQRLPPHNPTLADVTNRAAHTVEIAPQLRSEFLNISVRLRTPAYETRGRQRLAAHDRGAAEDQLV